MPTHSSERLDGWKAIASYLGRDERTAQRWARERGMPVHHVPGLRGGGVFVFREELDTWLLSPGNHRPRKVPAAGRAGSEASAHAQGLSTPPPSPSRPGLSWKHWLALGAFAAATVSGASVLLWFEAPPPPTVSTVELAGKSLVAQDASGRTVWTCTLPRLSAGADSREAAPAPPGQLLDWTFIDFDADGQREVLVTLENGLRGAPVRRTSGEMSYPMVCLSPRGVPLWTYRPELALTFAGRRFDGPWVHTLSLKPEVSLTNELWLGLYHHTWWPSFLVSIDPSGKQTLRYVSSGHVYALASMRHAMRRLVLAAGINNEYAAASLAAIDVDGAPATSPQTSSSPYRCDGCPAGRPVRYTLFPRSELNELLGDPYNRAEQVVVATSHVEVSVHEGALVDRSVRTVYRLSRDLDVESVAMSDSYWQVHRLLERDGKIRHPVQRCGEYTKGKEIRTWTPASGWTTTWARQESKLGSQ